jgi:hypothetical protein
MRYEDVIADFAVRTRKNLEFVQRIQADDPEIEVYEVTQLVNSMLGLLVFPKERYFQRIPETPLTQLIDEGWPIPKVRGDFEQPRTLRGLIRLLRNAIAHFNVAFRANEEGQIRGLIVWNMNHGRKNWEAELTLRELQGLTERFTTMLIEQSSTPSYLFPDRASATIGNRSVTGQITDD